MIIEIYFYELSEEKQEEILEAYGLASAEEMNWDVFPLFTLETGDAE